MKLSNRSRFLFVFAGLILFGSIVAPSHSQNSIKIIGSVVDPNSAPIPGAHITLYSLDRILQTTSDPSGHFHFDEMRPTRYELEVMVPGFKRFTKPVDVTENKPIELMTTMEIAPAGSPMKIVSVMEVAPTGTCGPPDSVVYNSRTTADIAGFSGIAIEQYTNRRLGAATVQLFDTIGVQIGQQETNDDGEFQFRQIAPGRYHVVLIHSGNDNLKSREFWVARENVTRMTMRPLPAGKIMICQ